MLLQNPYELYEAAEGDGMAQQSHEGQHVERHRWERRMERLRRGGPVLI